MKIALKSSNPDGIAAITQRLSEATPPDSPARRNPSRTPTRSGSIALLLVLVLTLLFGTFAISISRQSAQQTRSEADRGAVTVLESAVASVADGSIPIQPKGTILRLPVDEDRGRRIEVEWVDSSANEMKLRATLLQLDRPVSFIDRTITLPSSN